MNEIMAYVVDVALVIAAIWSVYMAHKSKKLNARNDPVVSRCHCGRLAVHTEFSPFMDQYCNDCTYARCDINTASDCPTLYKNKRR